MKKLLVEGFGWYGAIAIVGAYALNSFGIISAKSLPYQLLNLTGAFGIIIDSIYKKDYQPAVLNIFWVLIALIAIGRLFT